jgi:hypothetical protein
MLRLALWFLALFCVFGSASAFQPGSAQSADGAEGGPIDEAYIAPAPSGSTAIASAAEPSIEWRRLSDGSIRFLGIMHAFRWATEVGTRAGGVGMGQGYRDSVANLHGWSDGDPAYVNYVGHPMQGAVAGQLYIQNDRRFSATEFGRDPQYWKGRFRAAAFAWAFSEQFEIGPLSEASIGHIQAQYPQQGLVDHVITPALGLGWMLAEDALDLYAIKPLEGLTRNRWARMMLRSWLNPTRSLANVVNGRAPWHRDTREGILAYRPAAAKLRRSAAMNVPVEDAPAPFEFSVTSGVRTFGGRQCLGGGGEAAYRAAPELQLVLDVNGCKLLGTEANTSGDALVFQAGPRWTPSPSGRWSPYAHVLAGGMKTTRERIDPVRRALVQQANRDIDPAIAYTLHGQYAETEEYTGLALSAGAGMDYRLNPAVAIRVAGVEYLRSTVRGPGGIYSGGLQLKTGMVLRFGTW